mmetsp:Transcript_14546/g.20651  ORF Transcript_14546/g.20651 Transcript_14546/m.20651 type:complete len:684 (+) Transcript_14546:1-2052(+)
MTKDNLIKNLGIVAKSGTTEFLEAATKGKKEDNLSLIGQFGVGFYSVYLVAEKVTVVSKHADDDQHVWESTANAVFTVAKDPRGDTLGRGTQITIHLKEDAEEFLNDETLTKIVTRYSQFVNFPIKLYTTKTVKKQVRDEEAEAAREEAKAKKKESSESSGEDDLEVLEEDDEQDTKPIMKEVDETEEEWKILNSAKAIWTRNPKEVTEQEYKEFFETFKLNLGEPIERIHFVAEGEVTFRSLLYIPEKADPMTQDSKEMRKSGVKLYVRRVLISDEFDDFLPRYMNFIKGVVDSDDLPLNVSRETLAQSRVLKVMSKKLVRKVLDMLRKMSNAEEKDEDDESSESSKEDEEESKYSKFWKEHGKQIKFGVIDDRKNKAKLTKLLRFPTSKSNEKEVSLESYVSRMPKDQKYIYFITGESLAKVKDSPFVQKVEAKGYEIIYMVDPIDEYVVQSLTEYDGIEMQSVTKEGLKLGDEDKEKEKAQEEEFKPLVTWLKNKFEKKVEKVKVSNRLVTAPCVLVTGQYGWSANMERIMKSATLATQQAGMQARKTLEINPNHPIIQALKAKIEGDEDNDSLVDMANLLLDASLIESGFNVDDIDKFNQRSTRAISIGLGIDPEGKVVEEIPDPEEEEKEDAEEDAEEAKEGDEDTEAKEDDKEDAKEEAKEDDKEEAKDESKGHEEL